MVRPPDGGGGEEAVGAEEVCQGDAAEAAAGLPEETATVHEMLPLQSMNTNSFTLNSTRQAFASPCFRAYPVSASFSSGTGPRPRASR